MKATSSAALEQRRAAVERRIETLQRVIAGIAVVWTVMLMFLGVFFFPYVLIRWGFVH